MGRKLISEPGNGLPIIEWQEVRSHLFQSLMLDQEWVTDEADGFWWQSSLIPTHVSVTGRGYLDEDETDPWLRVTAETPLLATDEQTGSTIASSLNSIYPYGAFFWIDGYVTGMSSTNFNSHSRGELSLFHNAVLGQATVANFAFEIASGSSDEARDTAWAQVQAIAELRPPMILRPEPDNLLSLHWGDRLPSPDSIMDLELETVTRWEYARHEYEQLMLSRGYEPGFSDDSVTFFQSSSGWAIGVGLRPDSPWTDRWGPGLDVSCVVSPALEQPPDELAVNDGNGILATHGPSSIGHLTVNRAEDYSLLAVESFLPTQYLAYSRGSDSSLATTVFNAVGHIGAGASTVVIPQ